MNDFQLVMYSSCLCFTDILIETFSHALFPFSRIACKPGYFKSSVQSKFCQVCPNNTKPSEPGATECQCREGFYRSSSDPPTSPCSGNGHMTIVYLLYFTRVRADKARCCLFPLAAPPSAPRDLSSSTLPAEGRLQLSWSPPLVTGGRSDLAYSVACEQCNGGQCVPCGEKIRFEPGPVDLQETTVVVTDLDAHLNYTFTVEAHSGVSQFSTKKATTSLTTALDYTGELRQHDVMSQIFSFFFFAHIWNA